MLHCMLSLPARKGDVYFATPPRVKGTFISQRRPALQPHCPEPTLHRVGEGGDYRVHWRGRLFRSGRTPEAADALVHKSTRILTLVENLLVHMCINLGDCNSHGAYVYTTTCWVLVYSTTASKRTTPSVTREWGGGLVPVVRKPWGFCRGCRGSVGAV